MTPPSSHGVGGGGRTGRAEDNVAEDGAAGCVLCEVAVVAAVGEEVVVGFVVVLLVAVALGGDGAAVQRSAIRRASSFRWRSSRSPLVRRLRNAKSNRDQDRSTKTQPWGTMARPTCSCNVLNGRRGRRRTSAFNHMLAPLFLRTPGYPRTARILLIDLNG